MSKSNKKSTDRLKDSCRRERLRDERHHVKQLLKHGEWEQVEDLEEEITIKERDD